jgi:hypothetical protein
LTFWDAKRSPSVVAKAAKNRGMRAIQATVALIKAARLLLWDEAWARE